jgi:hypothetical protein
MKAFLLAVGLIVTGVVLLSMQPSAPTMALNASAH